MGRDDRPAVPGKVGIFWRCHGQWWVHACDVREIEPDSLGFIDDPIGHYDYWAKLQDSHPQLRGIEYDDGGLAPRGRVLYDSGRARFMVYMASSLHSADVKHQLMETFELPKTRTCFATDEHYE